MLRDELEALPERMRDLPVDDRGYPVPKFVAWLNGKPEFRAFDAEFWMRAVAEHLCWVCGGRLGVFQTFVLGPMCGITRTTSEPPCHLECARWSARNCPFLARPHMVRREDEVTAQAEVAGIAIKRNPGVALLWTTRSFEIFEDGEGTAIVAPTTTSLTASPSPAILGQPVTLTATVSSGATGTVLFLDSAVALGTAPVQNGQAVLTTRLIQSGLRYLVATYAGDATHAPSSSAEVLETISALPANGFSTPASYSTGDSTGPVGIAASDFNQDGITDLVIADNGSNTVGILLGRGDGTFASPVNYVAGASPSAIAVADFNNDGVPDLAVSSNGTTAVDILIGNPDGTFQPARTLSVPSSGNQVVVASDFNGDGNADLVVFGVEYAVILLGNGDGTFTSDAIVDTFAVGVVADFKRNRKVDLYNPFTGVNLGNGDGTFQYATYAGAGFAAITAVAAGDVNGDGKPDIVLGGDGNIVVLLGNGDGTFQNAMTYPIYAGVNSLASADINGDGKLDVIATDGNSGVYVLLGNGDGTLQPPSFTSLGALTKGVVAGDFNGDGRTDLAIATYGAGSVSVLLGVFPSLTITSSHSDPFTLGQTGAVYTITVSNNGVAPTNGAVTVTDSLPAGLTATAISGTNWNCTLTNLTCTRSDSLPASKSYDPVMVAFNVTASNTGSGVNQVSAAGGGAATANASDPTTIIGAPIAFQTSPSGLAITVNGGVAQPTKNLAPGTYTIAVASPQPGSPGTQYVFTNWSDGGNASHTITVGTTSATYVASFQTQYQLTAIANPMPGGSITPTTGTYFNAGSTVTLTATPNPPYVFATWSNGSTANPLQFAIDAPVSITASFNVPGFTCAITGDGDATITDVQQIIDEALGTAPPKDTLAHANFVGVADIQKLVDAVLGLGCLY